MNTRTTLNFRLNFSKQRGFSIIEIAAAILVFAIGILALGYLQNNLTRSQGDATNRATATNIAEQVIEQVRGFETLGAGTGQAAYGDIAEAALPSGQITVGNAVFTVAPNVVDYRWTGNDFECFAGEFDNGNDAARCQAGAPADAPEFSDMKLLEVTVSWDGAEFTRQQGEALGNLTDRSVTLSTYVNSVTTKSAARTQDATGEPFVLPTSYTPGENPDIVPVALASSRFKESTMPEPDLDALLGVTTWDVITYATNRDASEFLRREEFRAVSCVCEFEAARPAPEPTVWMGDEYLVQPENEWPSKVTGVSANTPRNPSTNDRLCDRCCANHHDHDDSSGDGNGLEGHRRYRPFDSDRTASGNHVHYNVESGTLVPVPEEPGQTYLEACRMVRVDGFWQVSQDLRNEQRFVFPGTFLDERGEIDVYSNYLTSSVDRHFAAVEDLETSGEYPEIMPSWCPNGGAGCIPEPPYGPAYPNPTPANQFPSYSVIFESMLSAPFVTSDRLRSRGLYIDHMHPDLVALIGCLYDSGSVPFESLPCKEDDVPGVGKAVLDRFQTTNALEILPFFEVQLTSINQWSSSEPVEIDSDPRGLATGFEPGTSPVDILFYQGNMSLLDILPYLPEFDASDRPVAPEITESLFVHVLDENSLNPDYEEPLGVLIKGFITPDSNRFKTKFSVRYVGAENAAFCSVGSGSWRCIVPDFESDPRPTVTMEIVKNSAADTCTYTLQSAGGLDVSNDTEAGTATIQLSADGAPPSSYDQDLEVIQSGC